MDRYQSPPLPTPVHPGEPAPYRIDLELRGVDHSGASFEGRVFVNNAEADVATDRVSESGYAGSFYVFGHGPCYGADGHCDTSVSPPITPYDYRSPHDLLPQSHAVDITAAVLPLGPGEFTVTIVAVVNTPEDPYAQLDVLSFERLSVISYDASTPRSGNGTAASG